MNAQLNLEQQRGLDPRRLLFGACLLLALAGCGQKGALYLPDQKPQAVPAAPASAAAAPATPGAAAQTPATRKAPGTPDPATAR